MPSAKRSATQQQAVIGLDLGGTKLAAALFDTEGRAIVKRSLPLEKRQGHAVGELIISQVRRLLQTGEAAEAARFAPLASASPESSSPKRAASGHRTSRAGTITHSRPRSKLPSPIRRSKSPSIATARRRSWAKPGRGRHATVATRFFWQSAPESARASSSMVACYTAAHGIAGAIGWLALDRPFRTEYTACGCFESSRLGRRDCRRCPRSSH